MSLIIKVSKLDILVDRVVALDKNIVYVPSGEYEGGKNSR